MSRYFSVNHFLTVAIAAWSGFSITTALADTCTPGWQMCEANGQGICEQLDSDPSWHLVHRDQGDLPQFSFWWDGGPRVDFSLDRQWETIDGKAVARSATPMAGLEWFIFGSPQFDASLCVENPSIQLVSRSDPFTEIILGLYPILDQGEPTIRVELVVSQYQWVDNTADFSLKLSLRGGPGESLKLEVDDEDGKIVSLGSLSLLFGAAAKQRPGNLDIPVELEVDRNAITIHTGNFAGTLVYE